MIKRRGKLGLIKVNADFPEVKSWVEERMGKNQQVGRATGKLRNFIIEPFIPHGQVRISVYHFYRLCPCQNIQNKALVSVNLH